MLRRSSGETENTMNNVVNFPGKSAIFSPDTRKRLEAGLKSYSERPEEAVNEVEKIICTQIITMARVGARRLGDWLAGKVIGATDNVIRKAQ